MQWEEIIAHQWISIPVVGVLQALVADLSHHMGEP